MSMKEISFEQLQMNPFAFMKKDCFLIVAPDGESVNPMTAGWGSFGVLWNKPVLSVVVRPQRYTYGLMEQTDTYTIAYFGSENRDAIRLCGSTSGRDTDKMKACGFTVGEVDGYRYIEQAQMVICCRKIYVQDMKPECFLDAQLMGQNYPDNDFHRFYVGEITKVLVQE